MIEIYAPRYHDRKILIANWKIAQGYPAEVRIKYGSYKGDYIIPWRALAYAPITNIKSKQDKNIPMRVVNLDDLERMGKDES